MSSDKNNKKKVDISKEGYDSFINQIIRKIEEERDLALDRYRMQDEQMNEPQDFVVMGKNAASFLNIASNRTDALFEMAKQIKEIIYKNQEEGGGSGEISDEERKMMEQVVKSMSKKEGDQEQEEDIKGDDIDSEDDLDDENDSPNPEKEE